MQADHDMEDQEVFDPQEKREVIDIDEDEVKEVDMDVDHEEDQEDDKERERFELHVTREAGQDLLERRCVCYR